MNEPFFYEMTILEQHLDTFGHVNHATYVQILDQARWEWVTRGGFGLENIRQTGIGPIVLGLSIRYARELNLRERVRIESRCASYRSRIATIEQKMIKPNGEIAATAEVKLGIFDTRARKLVSPPPGWLRAIGIPEA